MSEWQPIETAPKDRYILIFDADSPEWDGNIFVAKWFGSADETASFWTCGGPNGGIDLCPGVYRFTHWMPLPEPPEQLPESIQMNTHDHSQAAFNDEVLKRLAALEKDIIRLLGGVAALRELIAVLEKKQRAVNEALRLCSDVFVDGRDELCAALREALK